MRKSLFLTLVLSLCVADFGAFAATARGNTRGGASTNANTATQAAPVSARAGARQKVVSAPTTTSSASAPVSARAGARQKVASVPTTTAKTSSGNGNVAARAATKKALSMGTKVATATENTVVSQECQNAYYGCMDAFCMLDNAAGGRCQCSDRSAELDAVLDEIMRLDEQSARIATEGVEQIQMGEYADQINNRAKSVESGIASSKSGSSTSASGSKKSSSSTPKTLDLASLMNNNFFDAEEDDEGIFTEATEASVLDDIAGKTGDDLQKAAAKVCVAQVPAQCKSSLSMLQMAYAQKVKSDCVGYENALKQQRSASQQKLLTAQKAVRDAALDEVRKQNKYETTGECAIAFAQCMQTTAECGADYTGCVTLAAANNLKASINDDNNNKQAKRQNANNNNNKGGTSNRTTVKTTFASYTIKGVVSGADITLAASTMESLLAKKESCASVTKQCVNANKNDAVWDVFLRNAAPALKSAEVIAEQNLRSNCIPTVAECFKTACKSQFGENDESYDMCLSNPDTYKSLCKVQLEPCLNATGGTYENPEDSTLWTGLIAMLNSMKVDACTKEVKDCLLSEDRCGKDFSGCVGLDTYSIGRICPIEKLTACVTDGRFAKRTSKTKKDENGNDVFDSFTVENEDEIRNYVAQVAQGLALNIDNSFLTQCQNAANEAMIRVCGDTESCENIVFDLSEVESLMEVKACKWNDADASESKEGSLTCLPDLSQFTDDDIYSLDYSSKTAGAKLVRMKDGNGNDIGSYGVYATLLNKPDVSSITFKKTSDNSSNDDFVIEGMNGNASASTAKVIAILKGALDRTVGQIEADPKVVYCKTGRKVQGFDKDKFGKTDEQGGRFPNLTDEYKYVIASGLLDKLSEKNMELLEKFSEQVDAMDTKITERVAAIAQKRGAAVEAAVDRQNEIKCATKNIGGAAGGPIYRIVQAAYDSNTNVCTVKTTLGTCRHWVHGTWIRSSYCDRGYEVQEKTDVLKMPKFQ